jgi:hypothetical protein
MCLFAEIADKMWTIPSQWLCWSIFALAVFALGCLRWWLAGTALLVIAFWNYCMFDEYLVSPFGESVRNELGWEYIVDSFLAVNQPVIIAVAALVARAYIRSRVEPEIQMDDRYSARVSNRGPRG